MDYRTADRAASGEFTEKKSRFIGSISPVRTEAEAVAFIQQVKKAHPQARHHVYAYILRDGNLSRYSDAGEPSGTGGQPVLQVLVREGLTDVCVVVTRYFGGVLLGAGGLTRAYTQGAKDALDAAGTCLVSRWTLWDVPCTYPLLERVKLELTAAGAALEGVDYGADVTFHAAFPPGGEAGFAARLTELSAGALAMERRGESLRPGPREVR